MSETITTGLTILVPLDGSPLADQAIAYAAALGVPAQELHLLHVVPELKPPHDFRGNDLVMTEQDIEKTVEHDGQVTRNSAKIWQKAAPGFVHHLEYGDPAECILHVAKQIGADLIAMASHGRGALGRWRYGSVADRVARAAEVPVLIVRPRDAQEFFGPAHLHRFVVPLDGSDFAAQALPVATELAKRTHRPVHLVRVATEPVPVTAAFGSAVASAAVHDAALATERIAAGEMEQISKLTQTSGVPVTWNVDAGDPFERITSAAHPGDVIVIASHGRSGMRRWMLGSVAEKLIRLAEAPVLIVRTKATAD